MIEEVLINVNRFETRVALLEAGVVQEVHLQRAGGYTVTGNIYKGKVARILPGMQAAFVEIGLARPGFLHAHDVHFAAHTANRPTANSPTASSPTASSPAVTSPAVTSPAVTSNTAAQNGERDIRTLLHDGQEILVQVVKDPISGKGARLSTELALASRYVVLMPFSTNVGVSQRIEDECERNRLRGLLEGLRAQDGNPGGDVRLWFPPKEHS